jgi:hypothetical protein
MKHQPHSKLISHVFGWHEQLRNRIQQYGDVQPFSFCNDVFVIELHEHAFQDWMCNQCDFSSWVVDRQ